MTNSLFASTCEKTTEIKLRDFAKKNSISRIVFFATWCHSCLPKLNSLEESDIDVAFEKPETAEKALKILNIKNKCFYGEDALEYYKVKSLPFEIQL